MQNINSTSYTCFKKSEFSLYLFLITCIFVYLLYILYYKNKEQKENDNSQTIEAPLLNEINTKIQNLQDKLSQTQINTNYQQQQEQQQRQQQYQQQQYQDQQYQQQQYQQQQQILLDRIYNPLVSPERIYPGGRLYPKQQKYDDYQQIGFIFNNEERYPLYGRPKYPGKSDKYEYYIIDETRNHLKIPFKSKNDNEIYDGDDIFVDVFNNSFTVKIYNYDNIRYNPNLI